ncbi:MAG: gamma-glutamyl-phosphate reductase, partial [Spirochaetales bacterium]|nr:gamma-glutamyl-phosphate reductase [Candidatus Physcosoma equi]
MEEALFEEFRRVRANAAKLAISTDEERRVALKAIAKALLENQDYIQSENKKDLVNAERSGISSAVLHRLVFSDEKLSSVTKGLEELSLLPDPIGKTREKRELDPNFVLEKRTFPIGVIGMIFEARPDALVQIAGLALRSGNGIILKGGKEAMFSNRALIAVIKKATQSFSFGEGWIMGIESHEDVDALLKAEGYVDLLIPRGSNKFVKHVMDNTRIPVIGHADGICATYIDKDADLKMAVEVCT